MKETIKLGVTLLIITVVSAAILAVSNNLTKDQIAQIEMENSLGAITEIFNTSDEFENIEEAQLKEIQENTPSILEILEVYTGDDFDGYSIKSVGSGYAGDVVIATGISAEGELLGIRMIEHSETPGFGARAEEPSYTDQYVGLPADGDVEIEGLSGATKTDNTIQEKVNESIEVFNSNFAN